jgi:hypothetical protein
MMRRA